MYLTKVSLLERTSNSVAMPGLYRDRARFASGVTDDDAAVARALNNALTGVLIAPFCATDNGARFSTLE